MRILVTGRTGQLALSLAERAAARLDVDLITLGRPEFDLEVTGRIGEQIKALRPDLVINTAAYTAVDMAETEPDRAYAINRDGAAAVARAAEGLGVPFVHVSTDYVYDGRKSDPYIEADEATPLNTYGRSKLEGEREVLREHPGALILRSSWIYSPFGKNFLTTMLRIGTERSSLQVVDDQLGNPTSALDLATALLKIAPRLREEPGGLYHLAGSGSASWYEFANFIFAVSKGLGGPSPLVETVSSRSYPSSALRPSNSRLDCTAFEQRFGFGLRDWRVGTMDVVSRCLAT